MVYNTVYKVKRTNTVWYSIVLGLGDRSLVPLGVGPAEKTSVSYDVRTFNATNI